MAKSLIIVESPAKAKTLEKFLGKDFTVKASGGHIRDLPTHKLGVKVDQHFEPEYITIKDKEKIISQLTKSAQGKETIYLAPDPDREGEAIAWHLASVLGLDLSKVKRIEFNEITKTAVLKALESPREINIDRVNAQQARRILDRLVGYKLSPLLWKKVKKGLSAGRVQSVAVWLICEREEEIQKFIPEEYWTVKALLATAANKTKLTAELVKYKDKKLIIANGTEADNIVRQLKAAEYMVSQIENKIKKSNPEPPFITSTLQQEASRKLGWSAKKTMMVAQGLYEGIEIDGEHTGLITYMRTDSIRIADEAKQNGFAYVEQNYGKEYVGPAVFKQKKQKNIQDAHEAIRPTYIEKTPEMLLTHIGKDEYKLYNLIWRRFIAALMAPADVAVTTISIEAGEYTLKLTGSILEFPGFMTLYTESKDDDDSAEENIKLPKLTKGEKLTLNDLLSQQHFTKPPARYTEATLVKTLEEKGIGRPSTYAPIISTIVDRGYVDRLDKVKLVPTELGGIVNKQLKEYFAAIIDVDFTAKMETRLDEIMEGNMDWTIVLSDFYSQFLQELKMAESQMPKVKDEGKLTEIVCEKCGNFMLEKTSRYGSFLACKGFPKCRNTKPIVSVINVPCPQCKSELIEKRTKGGKVFYGCRNFPTCNFAVWNKPVPDKCTDCGGLMLQLGKTKTKCHQCGHVKENKNED